MQIGQAVRMYGRHGRIVDILTSQTGGDDYAKVRFVVHAQGVYEFHLLADLTPATDEDIRREVEARISKLEMAHRELLEQVRNV